MRIELQIDKLFFEWMLFYRASLVWYLITIKLRWGSAELKVLHVVKIKKNLLVYILNKKFVLKGAK